jgi:hypothetical protein
VYLDICVCINSRTDFLLVLILFPITLKGFTIMQTMQKKIGILMLLSLLSLVSSQASAQVTNILFDEYGNGFLNGSPLPFSVATDSQSGLSTLMYQLPFLVRQGDLFLTEGAAQPPSDLVRFDNISNTTGALTGAIYFYSDGYGDETPIPLADNPFGIPPANSAGFQVLTAIEQGIEGNDGYVYNPNPSDPGSDLGGTTITYTIISDGVAVPEPSAFVLLGMGAVGIIFYARRKRMQTAK